MSELLNLIGLSTGVALYAMLLVMVVRARRTPSAPRFDPLLLATAVLGLVWNLSALPAYELPKLGIAGPFPLLTAVGFSALGFLPAVVVQSVLRGERSAAGMWLRRSISVTAYAVSAVAAVLQTYAAWHGDTLPSVFGMRLLTYAFVALVVPLFAVTRGQPGARRTLWAAALSIFAVSALHLSQFHQGDASWPVELLGHHASLPLAFAILYQDFPFALADLFLKRALTLLAVVTTAFVAVVTFSAPADGVSSLGRARDVGSLVALWVATALLYPRLRDITGWFVDSVVLDRPDYESLQAAISARARGHEDIASVLDDACAQLAPALSARVVRWRELAATGADRPDEAGHPGAKAGGPVVASVDVPVAEPPRYAIEVFDLTGGRRLLSDDRAALESIAALLGRRIDAIRIARERYDRQLREQEIGKLATEAELRALRAQINPHFLFNALTTIGYLIQTAPPRALETLMRLTSLLRAVLRSEGEFTTLGREVEVIEAYLDIELARFEHRLAVTIEVPFALRGIRVPPLVLQPLVENAVKHGIAPQRHGGAVTVCASLETGQAETGRLVLTVHDTGAGASAAALERGRTSGVGLQNVERRLLGQYGETASLSIRSVPGEGTTVEIRLPIHVKTDAHQPFDVPRDRAVM
jgi:two-component system LytT family sensor kinase